MEYDHRAVGVVIRKIRKERKLSQEVVSGLAGLARSHIAMIESGAKSANFETIWKIANAFDIPPHMLVKMIENEIQHKNGQ